MSYLKELKDQRDLKTKEMKEILDGAKTENRAMNEEEQQKWDELDKVVKNIDKTIEAEKRAIEMNGRKKDHGEGGTTETEEQKKEREVMEERAFCDFVLSAVENRAGEGNLSYGNSGAIIPTSIANRIITEVKDRSPILQRAEVYFVKGNLSVPVYGADDSGNDITVAFTEDFAEITANGGKFKSVDLKGYLMGALALVGRQLRNNAAFDVVGFVVSQMAEKIALFLEGKLLNGEPDKMEGALATKTVVTAGSATAITGDDFVKVQAAVKQAHQANACWIMSAETFLAAKLLKDGNDRYLMQDDITGEIPYRLLGKPVFLSDNMPEIASGKTPVLYGDMKGLGVKIGANLECQVLNEAFATKNAIGVIAWMEVDSKVIDHQRMAVLKMAA